MVGSVGVNPAHDELLGVPVYPSLEAVPGPVDIVDIFRRIRATPGVLKVTRVIG